MNKDLVNYLAKDTDFKSAVLYLLLWFSVGFGFLFYNSVVSLVIFCMLASLVRTVNRVIRNKAQLLESITNDLSQKSKVINYNKGLTDAINLLFHNDPVQRENGKNIINTEFPEHSYIVTSAERMFEYDNSSYTPNTNIKVN